MNLIQALNSNNDKMIVEYLIAHFYQTYPDMRYVIDAGANMGFHFKRMNALPQIQRCVGVEANPEHISGLQSLAIAHKSSLVAKALVGNNFSASEVTFKVNKMFHGRGGVKGSHIWELINPELEFTEVTVPTIQLDCLIREFFPSQLDFIKMDLEGSELGILLNSSRVWEMNCIIVMENSVHGPTLNGITKEDWIGFVASKNYLLVDFNFEPCHPQTLFNYNHALLIPKTQYQVAKDTFWRSVQLLGLT